MTIQVNIGDAKARLSELLARVEDGEEIIIKRGNDVIARIIGEQSKPHPGQIIAGMKQRREQRRARGKTVSPEEMAAWKEEGRA